MRGERRIVESGGNGTGASRIVRAVNFVAGADFSTHRLGPEAGTVKPPALPSGYLGIKTSAEVGGRRCVRVRQSEGQVDGPLRRGHSEGNEPLGHYIAVFVLQVPRRPSVLQDAFHARREVVIEVLNILRSQSEDGRPLILL